MRTEGASRAWWLCCAAFVAAQILALGSLPVEIAEPWDSLWHVLAYSALALLLYIATDGARPLAVLLAIAVLGAVDELRQAGLPGRSADVMDFAIGLLAAATTVGSLAMASGKAGIRNAAGARTPCAESSER